MMGKLVLQIFQDCLIVLMCTFCFIREYIAEDNIKRHWHQVSWLCLQIESSNRCSHSILCELLLMTLFSFMFSSFAAVLTHLVMYWMLGLMDEICRGSGPSSYVGRVILEHSCTNTPFIRGFISLSCSSLPLDADSERPRTWAFSTPWMVLFKETKSFREWRKLISGDIPSRHQGVKSYMIEQ